MDAKHRDDEVLLVRDPDQPGVVLNRSAYAIWDLCDGNRTVEGISRELERLLELPEGALLADVARAVDEFATSGLVELRAGEEPRRPVPPQSPSRTSAAPERLARPRADLADLDLALAHFAAIAPKAHARYLALRAEPGEPTFLGGQLVLRRCYDRFDTPLVDAPADHPNLAAAMDWLSAWPLGEAQVRHWMRVLHPLVDERLPDDESGFLRGSSCHSDDSPKFMGTLWSTINCPFMLAENLVHELAHQKLFALGILKEKTSGWIANTPEHIYRSPIITDRLRPMSALVHGVYAYMYVTAFDLAALDRPNPKSVRKALRKRLSVNLGRIRAGGAEIHRHLRTDGQGAQFFAGYFSWLEELEREAEHAAQDSTPQNGRAHAKALEPVRIFVGTDPKQKRAEIALEESIRRTITGPYEITWMNHGLGGLWADWKIGRERGKLPLNGDAGWATEFTGYRFAVPEAAGFRGRAIYLDVDMLALRDLRELFDSEMPRPWMTTPNCTSVILVDCEHFRDRKWWPRVKHLRRMVSVKQKCTGILKERDLVGYLDPNWNCLDGKGFRRGETGILHFTARATQPWRPYPEVFRYSPHARPDMEEIWWEAYLDGRRRGRAPEESESPHTRSRPGPRYREHLEACRSEQLRTAAALLESGPAAVRRGLGLLPHVAQVGRLVRANAAKSVLDYGSGNGLQYALPMSSVNGLLRDRGEPEIALQEGDRSKTIAEWWGLGQLVCFDPAYPPLSSPPAGSFDGVVCTDWLDQCPEEDVDWILHEVFHAARRFVYLALAGAPGPAEGSHPVGPRSARPTHWWVAKLLAAAASHPGKQLELRLGKVCVSTR
ncbi:MAG TPA: PqqD family peptide modification chaperone [Planctomycetota bacterium]|nr:PqqD family peptide modification chaperone [Planctomycetota bacterium]